MQQHESNGQAFDDLMAEYLSDWGQRVSRRGWLARLGNITLRIAGVSLLPLLPVDRIQADATTCGDWRLCGMFGNLCNDCCGTASLFDCPSCTTKGANSWWRCCPNFEAQQCPIPGQYINYWDCCASTLEQANSCKGARCELGATQPAWCTNGYRYGCTVIAMGGTCVI